jgi:hypothetical protein
MEGRGQGHVGAQSHRWDPCRSLSGIGQLGEKGLGSPSQKVPRTEN